MAKAKRQPGQSLSQTSGFTNLSQDPQIQAAERNFADKVEALLQNAGIPVENQVHIMSQVQTDLTSQLDSDA